MTNGLVNRTLRTNILLTGAGFTHNFGAPLSSGMWALVFNHKSLNEHSRLRECLRNDFNFERVFQHITKSGVFSQDEIVAINNAVLNAYGILDEVVRNWSYKEVSRSTVNIYKVRDFLESFCGSTKKPGFIFTLNQDLFFERQTWNALPPSIPGVRPPRHDLWFNEHFKQPIDDSNAALIPATADEAKLLFENDLNGKAFHYVKLHGSYGWKRTNGSVPLVIGMNDKDKQIQDEPILKFYQDLFSQCIRRNGVRLWVLGYGFADPHINDVIRNAIEQEHIEVCVISPEAPRNLWSRLVGAQTPNGEKIWDGICRYYQNDLRTLFPGDQTETPTWKQILAEIKSDL